MRRFPWARVVVVLGLAGALVGGVPDGVSAVAARGRCATTAFVANRLSDTVSAIDLKTRTKHVAVSVGAAPLAVAATPDGDAACGTELRRGTESTNDLNTRTKHAVDMHF